MQVIAKKLIDAAPGGSYNISKVYTQNEGLECKEIKSLYCESDFLNGREFRYSKDNGRTWGEWQKAENPTSTIMYGDDEVGFAETPRKWNPVHKHYVSVYWTRYYVNGHEEAYEKFWKHGECALYDHQYIRVSEKAEGDFLTTDLIKYEDGADFDPKNPRNPEFLEKNRGYINEPSIMECGDIIVPVGVPVDVGCKMAGLDVNRVFPNCANIFRCVVVARGKFDKETGKYNFTFSNPIILNSLRSSRGMDEPIVVELKSSRILLVTRGSNVQNAAWKTRIEEGTPSFKWFAFSDDGGKTFTEAEPWRFNDREVIYSAATISLFARSTKNGKLYWIGNIAPHTAYGNYPRYPLYIAEVDDKLGILKKETLTVIDTKREGEANEVQLSNFSFIEDRETLNFEICLDKIQQYDKNRPYFGETWKYEIVLD